MGDTVPDAECVTEPVVEKEEEPVEETVKEPVDEDEGDAEYDIVPVAVTEDDEHIVGVRVVVKLVELDKDVVKETVTLTVALAEFEA